MKTIATLKPGMKFKPRKIKDGRYDARFNDRVIQIVNNNLDHKGRMAVISHNYTTGALRHIKIEAKRLASSAYKLLPVLIVAFMAACAGAAPKPKTLACQTAPQWYTSDANGRPAVAVFVCFRDDGSLTYTSRPLTAEEVAAMIAPEPKPKHKSLPVVGAVKPK